VLRVVGIAVIVAAGLVGASAPARAAPAAPTPEAQIKAGIVFNLAMVVSWPGSALDADTFTIGVIGDDESDPSLAHLAGKEVQRRKLVLRDPLPLAAVLETQVMYISRAKHAEIPALLAATSGQPVLTVSDVAGFCEAGGMVELRRERNRIQLRVNREATERAGLRLSSQLLKMAEIVKGGD
jgi:hypothetical protein